MNINLTLFGQMVTFAIIVWFCMKFMNKMTSPWNLDYQPINLLEFPLKAVQLT